MNLHTAHRMWGWGWGWVRKHAKHHSRGLQHITKLLLWLHRNAFPLEFYQSPTCTLLNITSDLMHTQWMIVLTKQVLVLERLQRQWPVWCFSTAGEGQSTLTWPQVGPTDYHIHSSSNTRKRKSRCSLQTLPKVTHLALGSSTGYVWLVNITLWLEHHSWIHAIETEVRKWARVSV